MTRKERAVRWAISTLTRIAEPFSGKPLSHTRNRVSGNVFFVVFAALAMVGGIGYGFNSVLRGPIANMTEVTRRTVAENSVINTAKIAIVSATTQQTLGGDCDADGMIEPLPYHNAGAGQHPAGGGWLPRGVGPPAWSLVTNSLDPWKTEYGYCAWDSGSVVAAPGCGGATGRLAGSPNKNVQAILIISAGKNKRFETTCSAYNGATPNAALYNKPAGSDDVVLPYTYAEANDLGNGMWTPDAVTPATDSATKKNIEVKGGGTFTGAVQMTGAGGLVLPGDPGDDSITGACDAINDKQLRRNIADPDNPTIELCDFTNGLGWSSISGSGGTGSTGGMRVAQWKMDETTGTTVFDSVSSHNGTLTGGAWAPTGGAVGGALTFAGGSDRVEIPATGVLQPSSISLTFWMKRNGAQGIDAGLIARPYNSFAGPEEASYMVAFLGASDLYLKFVTGYTGGQNPLHTSSAIPDLVWTHVAMIYDPLLPSNQKKIYVNGVLDAQTTVTNPIVYDAVSSPQLLLGRASTSFSGMLDDVRIYNYGLSSEEVSRIYSSGAPAISTSPSSLKKGKLFSVGSDVMGQNGNGTTFGNTSSVFPVSNGHDFVQMSAGVEHSCGVKSDGTVWCWGGDTNGVLGNGAAITANQHEPIQVAGLTNIVKVSAASSHSCALSSNGKAWCWGANPFFQLGDDTVVTRHEPVAVKTPKLFIDITAGNSTTCALESSGIVSCWGKGTAGELGNGASLNARSPTAITAVTDFTQIDANPIAANVCGVTSTGKAYCWGTESNGNFGNGATSGLQNAPAQVSTYDTFRKIEIYGNTACGLMADGNITCWGSDSSGQVGNGPAGSTDVTTPYLIPSLTKFIDVSVGMTFACGIQESGYLWCWGSDTNGKLGNGSILTADQPSPSQALVPNVMSVAAGHTFTLVLYDESKNAVGPNVNSDMDKLALFPLNTCFLDPEGSIGCAGSDNTGQLGNGATSTDQNVLNVVTDLGPWKQVVGGGDNSTVNHTCAIKKNGNLYCWGTDNSGALGNGAVTGNQVDPYLVGTVNDTWSRVAAGKQSTCAIKQLDGKLYCWGSDAHDHLGVAGSGNQVSPAVVDSGSILWNDVAMAGDTVCAIDSTGGLYCWGDNTNGQVGNNSTVDVDVPTKIASNIPWINVSVGTESTCAVKSDASLWCWGSVGGNILTNKQNIPTLIPDPGPWTAVSVYSRHACALKADGSAWCWGIADRGQLGNNSVTSPVSLPDRVLGGNNWSAIKVGPSRSCGLKNDGSAWCWGSESNGELANGPTLTADQLYPSRVMHYPRKAAFTWNTNLESFSPPMGVDVTVGNVRHFSYDGAANSGLGPTPGMMGSTRITQPANPSVLALNSIGNGGGAQLLMGNSVGGNTNDIILPGLIAHYKLDSSTGTAAIDAARGLTGAVMNAPVWVPAGGKKAGSLRLTAASSQYVSVERDAKQEHSSVTVSAWIKRYGAQVDDATVVSKFGTVGAPYGLSFIGSSDTRLQFNIYTASGATNVPMGSSFSVTNETWMHVVGTYDADDTAPQLRIYLDGEIAGATTLTEPLVYDTTPAGRLYIGSSNGSANFFYGEVDDVQIYDRALSPPEVRNLYKSYNSANYLHRVIGLDYASGVYSFARNNMGGDKWISDIYQHDIEVDNRGRVGIGTTGVPFAALDVNGSIRVGQDGVCTTAKSGMIALSSGILKYCDASGNFKNFGTSLLKMDWNKMGKGRCAIKANGSAWCWSYNTSGSIGDGTTGAAKTRPVMVQTNTGPDGWYDWVSIANGGTSCGIRADGTAWCWGSGSNGTLGNGGSTNRSRPVQVQTNTGPGGWSDWTEISLYTTTCGIRGNGTAWCWGPGPWGELGNGTTPATQTRPVQVQTDTGPGAWSDWVSINSGLAGTCGLRVNGTMWCWGSASGSRLGTGPSASDTSRPVQVQTDTGPGGWSDWVWLGQGGGFQRCGIRADGTAWCWGGGISGAVGNGTTTVQSRPVQVQTNTGPGAWSDWIKIYTHSDNTCGLRSNGTAWCWGLNNKGQLGIGASGTNYSRPVQVQTDTGPGGWSDWVELFPVGASVCGLRVNGTMWCWGEAANGALANGTTTPDQLRPVQVQ